MRSLCVVTEQRECGVSRDPHCVLPRSPDGWWNDRSMALELFLK